MSMHPEEQDPLVARPSQRRRWLRFLAYTFLALVLLGVYQIVFLARTSANRDWNHLHRSRVTLQDIQRSVVRDVQSPYQGMWENSDILESQLKRYGLKTKRTRGLESKTANLEVDGELVVPAPFTRLANSQEGLVSGPLLMVGPRIPGKSLEGSIVVAEIGRVPPAQLAREAADRGATALILECGATPPLFGMFESSIPTVLVASKIRGRSGTVRVERNDWIQETVESVIEGISRGEEVVIGDYRGTRTASVLEAARVLGKLNAESGWIPYRTVRFVFHCAFETYVPSNRAISYVSTGYIGSPAAASPVLLPTAQWVAHNLPLPLEVNWEVPQLAFGGSDILYKYGIPLVVAPALPQDDLARFIGLMASILTTHAIIPFRTHPVASAIPEARNFANFSSATSNYDKSLVKVIDEYTREYPWFAGLKKLHALTGMKEASLRLSKWERNFLNGAKHTFYGLDPSLTSIEFSPLGPEMLSKAVNRACRALNPPTQKPLDVLRASVEALIEHYVA